MYDNVKAPMRKVKRRYQLNVNQEGRSGAVLVRRENKVEQDVVVDTVAVCHQWNGNAEGEATVWEKTKRCQIVECKRKRNGEGKHGMLQLDQGQEKKNKLQSKTRESV